MTSPPPAPRPGGRGAVAALCLATLPFGLLQSLVAPALPRIQDELGTSTTATTWVFTSFLVSASVATAVVGRLGDVHGRRRVLLAVLAALAAGSAIAALAASLPLLILGRVVQGAGAGLFPLTFGIVRDELPAERVPGAIGVVAAMLGVGGGLGVVLGGLIVDHAGYRTLFWLPCGVCVLAALGVVTTIPPRPGARGTSVNRRSAVLLGGALVAILLAVSQAPAWGWAAPGTLGLLGAGIVLGVGWVRTDAGANDPLVDLRTMRRRGVWTAHLVAALLGAGMFVAFVLIPRLAETPVASGYGFGDSVTSAGLLLLPLTVLTLVVGSAASRIEGRWGSRTTVVAGCTACVLAYAALIGGPHSRGTLCAASALLGVGFGLAFSTMSNVIVHAVPSEQTGVATGVNTVARLVGGAFGTQIAAAILAGSARGEPGALPTLHGYEDAFAMAGAVVLLALAPAGAMPGRRRRRRRVDAALPEPSPARRGSAL